MSIIRHPVWQYAYFVNDIDEACHNWNKMVGAGPFHVVRHHIAEGFLYKGEHVEADVSYAFGQAGPAHVQFIAQHDDTPSIYRDMFEKGQEGFHHVAILVRDFEAEHQRLLDKGFECSCRLYADEVDAAYFDTRSVNGCYTEIHGEQLQIMGRWTAMKRAHDLWQPGDSPFMTL